MKQSMSEIIKEIHRKERKIYNVSECKRECKREKRKKLKKSEERKKESFI